MILNRRIELEREEINEIEAMLSFENDDDDDADDDELEEEPNLIQWITKKLQEAFDFGFAEGKKEKEK